MQLSVTEREQLYAILEKYDQNPKVQQMREFIQHGDVTTYQHCKNVVLVSCWLNHRLHLGADETSLAVGAFLHDFYLYDWHKKDLHSFSSFSGREARRLPIFFFYYTLFSYGRQGKKSSPGRTIPH